MQLTPFPLQVRATVSECTPSARVSSATQSTSASSYSGSGKSPEFHGDSDAWCSRFAVRAGPTEWPDYILAKHPQFKKTRLPSPFLMYYFDGKQATTLKQTFYRMNEKCSDR